jgi:hypothetical protein
MRILGETADERQQRLKTIRDESTVPGQIGGGTFLPHGIVSVPTQIRQTKKDTAKAGEVKGPLKAGDHAH